MVSKIAACVALLSVANSAAAEFVLMPRQTTAAPDATSAELPDVTEITNCHFHDTEVWCQAEGTEYSVEATPTVQSAFTDCHSHGSAMYCVDDSGGDVQLDLQASGGDSHGEEDDHGHGDEEADGGEEHCHEHAGIPHCVGGSSERSCNAPDRDYDIGLRVGLLFAIFATSAMGVFGPIFLYKIVPRNPILDTVFMVIKQFGTGIIISTAFVHLYSHAYMAFSNDCVGILQYEGTTSAIVMAGIFLSFLVEYFGSRIVLHKTRKLSSVNIEDRAKAVLQTEIVSILVMECGIIFHSLIIGLILVVSGDDFVMTLFIVILFHQVFEGLALGSRIATVGSPATSHPAVVTPGHTATEHGDGAQDKAVTTDHSSSSSSSVTPAPLALPMKKKLGLAALFAFVTPIGMAIGIGVLSQFNGSDRNTLIAIGTLDAVSAGILIWVGVVEMWAADWMTGNHGRKAELADASIGKVALGMFGLVAGLVVMSVLGNWA